VTVPYVVAKLISQIQGKVSGVVRTIFLRAADVIVNYWVAAMSIPGMSDVGISASCTTMTAYSAAQHAVNTYDGSF